MTRPLVTLLLLLLTPNVPAWDELGHRLVGELAERQLSVQARQEMALLLQGEADPGLGGIASWADAARDRPEYAHTAAYHYVTIHDPHCRYQATRDCREGRCVVAAIERYRDILQDRAQSRDERVEALKFLVHLVGDVHQPLHAGRRPDKGGNEFQIQLRGQGTNLHAVWDHHLLASAERSLEQWRTHMQANSSSVVHGTAAQWAQDSCTKTNEAGFYPPRPGELAPAYQAHHRAYAEQRLHEAAARLATLLEAALTLR